MQAISALAGLSLTTQSSVSHYSQDVDFDIIEEIIDRAPRSATSFPLVYRAYGEVLEANGISPSNDTAYYQFLLKLGVIRASTWGERWDLWKATNLESHTYDQQAKQNLARQSSLKAVTHQIKISPRKIRASPRNGGIAESGYGTSNGRSPRRIAAVRARVPFLASASSDLDEGFEAGTDEEGYIGRAKLDFGRTQSSEDREDEDVSYEDGQEEEGMSLVDVSRPSPRKEIQDGRQYHQHHQPSRERSRSLVGYTPSQSLNHSYDNDLMSIDIPIRTSTPVHAQHGRASAGEGHRTRTRVGTISPPLPPYTESDVSISTATQTNIDMDDNTTPEATPRTIASSYPDGRRDATRYDREGSQTPRPGTRSAVLQDQDDTVEKAILAEMDRRAVEFYETGLRGRCWDVWLQANEWIQTTTQQIDAVRSTILLRQTLNKWRTLHEHHLDLPNTADAHRETHLKTRVLTKWIRKMKDDDLAKREERYLSQQAREDMQGAWKKWRNNLVKRRTDRWTRDMRKREEGYRARQDENLLSTTLSYWRDRTRDTIHCSFADEHYTKTTKRKILSAWAYRTEQKVLLARVESEHATKKDQTLQRDIMAIWLQRVKLVQAERRMATGSERRLVKRVWEKWQLEKYRRTSAEELFERHGALRALRIWRKGLARIQRFQRQATDQARARDHDLMRSCLHVWVTSERGQLLLSVREGRLVKDAWAGWHRRAQAISKLDETARSFQHTRSEAQISKSFSRWRDRFGAHRNAALQADLIYENSRQISTLRIWKAASARIRVNRDTADKALVFFAQRTVMKCWKVALGRKRRDGWVEERRREHLRVIFGRWAEATVQSVQDRRAIGEIQARHDNTCLSRVLSKWTERVVAVKARELEVVERRDSALVVDAFTRWHTASTRVYELKSLMHSFIDVKLEDSLRGLLGHWRSQTIKSRQIRHAAAATRAETELRIKKEGFEMWYSAFRQRRLHPIEEDVTLRGEDALVFQVWDKWKASSKRLQAIQKDNNRVRKLGWSRWRKATMLAKQERLAAAASERRLIEDVFAVWKDIARQRTSLRTTRIRGRVRPSHSGPGQGTAILGQISRPVPPLRSITQTRPISPDPHSSEPPHAGRHRPNTGNYPASTASEPAYSRLRSELARRRRGASEEAEVEIENGQNQEGREQGKSAAGRGGGSELLRTLRGTLGNR